MLEEKKLEDLVDNYNFQRVPLSSSQRENLEKIYPYYGAQGIIDYVEDYIFDGEFILVAEDGENLKSQKNNVCTFATGKFWVNNHAHIIKANSENDNKYIFYKLNQIDFKSFVTGSAQPKLTKDNLNSIKLNVHKFAEQQKIASVLSTLDEKIALNNQINATLEQMAKTLYDYWFVQFDFPDDNGKPYKSSGGEMVYNETLKRDIPKGWEVKDLGSIAHLYQPQTLSESDLLGDGKYLVYGANGIIGRYDKFNHEKPMVTITCRGNTCGNINITMPFSWITGNAMVVNPKNEVYGIDYLNNLLSHSKLSNTITGSAQPQITRTNLAPLTIIDPVIDIIEKYNNTTKYFFSMKVGNLQENIELTKLRDWLLPMLMNGQITVQ